MSNEIEQTEIGALYFQTPEGTWEKVARIDDAEWDIAPGVEWEHTGEPVKNFALEKEDFTIVLRMPKKAARQIWREVCPSRERLRRLRAAKRRNRERRIRRWKDRVVTPPALLRIIRKAAKRAQETLENFLYYAKTPLEKIIVEAGLAIAQAVPTDCVGLVKGLCWGEATEEQEEEQGEHK